ncbi:MSHA biogenesis protein MshP [Vibrio parahaemolyticus]
MSHKQKNSGNVLIVCLFVIIVMGYLGAMLTKTNWSNQNSMTREFLGTQAWFYAQSSTEWALTEIYPLNNENPDVGSNCSNKVNGKAPSSESIDYGSCRLVSLVCDGGDKKLDSQTFYRIEAAVQCGSGLSLVERRQEIWIKD